MIQNVLQDLDDPNPKPALQILAETKLPLTVPWIHQFVALGTGFESTLISGTSPWVSSRSPFLSEDLRKALLVYEGQTVGNATYRDSESSSHSTGSEHTSGSLGLTVGVPFVSASVTATYDKTVLTSNDSNRVSRTCLVREGTVRFRHEPQLSPTATAMLSGSNGQERFRENFGDYFVSSYILGGDAGVYVSTSHDTTSTTTKEKITVTVKVLFFKKSWTEEKTETSFTETFEATLSMYDTLKNTIAEVKPPNGGNGTRVVSRQEFAALVQRCQQGLHDVQELPNRVRQRLTELHLDKDQAEITWEKCADVCNAGVVVQLILMPFHYLRDYKIALARAGLL